MKNIKATVPITNKKYLNKNYNKYEIKLKSKSYLSKIENIT